MNLQFVREPEHHYLEIRADAVPDLSSYDMRMLLSGTCRRLLRCSLHHADGTAMLRYDISLLKPLHLCFAGRPPSREMVLQVLGSAAAGLLELSDCLLDPAHVLLDASALFCDPEQKEIFFVYVPWEKRAFAPAFAGLARTLLGLADPEDDAAALLLFRVYRRSLEGDLSPDLLLSFLSRETGRQTVPQISALPAAASVTDEPVPGEPVCLSSGSSNFVPEDKPAKKESLWLRLRRFGKKGDPSGDGSFEEPSDHAALLPYNEAKGFHEADEPGSPLPPPVQDAPDLTVLLHERKSKACLLPLEGAALTRIDLERESFTLGKQPGLADEVLPHPAVSRLHARITKRGDTYYLEDLCSKNGTFVNDVPLAANEKHALKNGDRIRFAALRYSVKLN